MAKNQRRTVLTGPEQRPNQRSKGAGPDGMLPGGKGNLDPRKAGGAWETHQLGEDGVEKHYVLPTKPGDRPGKPDSGFMGDAVERFKKTGEHYGAFDSDEAGQEYMRRAQSKKD